MPKYTARTADPHELYQIAVQSPEAEVAFLDRVYRERYGRPPARFREDFCGTALVSCEFVCTRPNNHATGIDLDGPTLNWGRAHNLARLPAEAARRVDLVQQDVRCVRRPRVQVVGAFNFSYYLFKTFGELVGYFRVARASLEKEGLMVVDAYGGYEAQQVMQERTRHPGFTYVWDQAEYNPINDHTVCHIHFRFPDGTQLRRAFTYDWRLWTLGGIRDAFAAAGFGSTEVYWEGMTRAGFGSGVYRRKGTAENTAGWNAYIVAVP